LPRQVNGEALVKECISSPSTLMEGSVHEFVPGSFDCGVGTLFLDLEASRDILGRAPLGGAILEEIQLQFVFHLKFEQLFDDLYSHV
jgi:hypothetical protein